LKKLITHLIAEYIIKSKYEDFPPEIINKAKQCILDSIGCMFGGVISKEGKILLNSLLLKENGASTIVGYFKKTTFLNSIFINSMSANILDFDDYLLGHPGATIIPPALNLAEFLELSGENLITSIIIAYEISIRLGINLQPTISRKTILGHGTWQTFGAASVACKLLNLSNESIMNAFGIAGANAPVPSVMKTTYGIEGPTMAKNNFGSASVIGVLSGLLAKNEFTGPKDIFDGDTGFWRMIGLGRNQLDLHIFDDMDKKFHILDVSFKLYPCCALLHPTICSIIDCINRNNIELNKIKKIIVESISLLSKTPFNKVKPKDAREGRFSLPYTLSCAIHHVNVLEWYKESNVNNLKLLNLAEKIEVKANLQADKVFEKDQKTILSSTCIILDDNNKVFSEKLSNQEFTNSLLNLDKNLKNKFFQLAYPVVVSSRKIDYLVKIIMELEKVSNVRKWLRKIRPGGNF